MARYAFITRALSVAGLSCFCGIGAIAWRGKQRPAAPKYTIAFKSFAPNNTDIFIAERDGNHARPPCPGRSTGLQRLLLSRRTMGRLYIAPLWHCQTYTACTRTDQAWSASPMITAFDDQGTLSPDGKTLAFVSSRSGQSGYLGTRSCDPEAT